MHDNNNTSGGQIDVKGCRQRADTREAKRIIGRCMSELGAVMTIFEHPRIGCDVLVVTGTAEQAVEYQHRAKHILDNIARDFRHDIEGVLVITPSFRVCREIANKLAKDLPDEWVSRVGLMTLDTLRLLALGRSAHQ